MFYTEFIVLSTSTRRPASTRGGTRILELNISMEEQVTERELKQIIEITTNESDLGLQHRQFYPCKTYETEPGTD